ncbi:MAG TPA: DUF502 domain-containing protein [Nitrospirales bacterium]|jgi:uncharacterized membrane protein|nr:DUF502 domain-containing protein [Nitrospirales bacterium]
MLKVSLKRYFITGLLVVVPIWGTVLVLKTLFVTLDGLLGDIPAKYVTQRYVPGVGILVLVSVILLAGVLATNIMGRRIVAGWEDFLQRVPVVRGIYATIKAMMDVLSFKDRTGVVTKYSRVVMIEFPRKGQYALALVTGVTPGEVQDISPERVINVYVPTSPNPTSGYLLFVPENELIPVNMSVDEAMKMMFSGGMYTPPVPETVGAGAVRKA